MAQKIPPSSAPQSTRLYRYLGIVSLGLIAVPLALSIPNDGLENLPPANEGAFEGGATGTPEDAFDEAIPEALLGGGEVPTGGSPSPLFGAQAFTERMLRFEEFGTEEMPNSFPLGQSLPGPQGVEGFPNGNQLDSFLAQPMSPEPARLAHSELRNPWEPLIEQFLGRDLANPQAEGRPPGEGWAHQRWEEFPPEVSFTTAQTGARRNSGLRDGKQLHGYTAGEFGPGGLYHRNGTTAGLDIRFHPAMPIQEERVAIVKSAQPNSAALPAKQ